MPTQDKMIDANTVTAAYREYDCHMPDGREIVVGVSLGDPSSSAALSHENWVLVHGHITERNGGRSRLWMHTPSDLKVVGAGDDPEVSAELQSVLLRVLQVFFREVRHVAPGLEEP